MSAAARAIPMNASRALPHYDGLSPTHRQLRPGLSAVAQLAFDQRAVAVRVVAGTGGGTGSPQAAARRIVSTRLAHADQLSRCS